MILASLPSRWPHCVGKFPQPTVTRLSPVHRYRVTRLFSRNCCTRVVYVSVVVNTCTWLLCRLSPPCKSFVRRPPFSSDRPSTTNINNIIVVIPQQVNHRRIRSAVVDRRRRGFSLKTGECSTEKPVFRILYSTRHTINSTPGQRAKHDSYFTRHRPPAPIIGFLLARPGPPRCRK